MQSTRRARLASIIQDELSRVVPREVKDPRIPSVTFTQVQVSPDGSLAKVFVMLLGRGLGGESESKQFRKEMKDCLAGLTSASGYLKRHLASCLDTRHVPQLVFEEDRGLENTLRVHELLQQISQEGARTGDSAAAAPAEKPAENEEADSPSEDHDPAGNS